MSESISKEEEELLKKERRALCVIHNTRVLKIEGRTEKIENALYGNGHPEDGILFMAKESYKTIAWVKKALLGIILAFLTKIAVGYVPAVVHWISTKL